MIRLLRTKSLRSWVAIGMVIALAPLFLSMIGGFGVLTFGVIEPFHDVANRQRSQIAPLQAQRLAILETIAPLDAHVGHGDPSHFQQFRALRERIDAGFVQLITALEDEPAAQALLIRARDDWTEADRNAAELLAVRGDVTPQRGEMVERYHAQVAALSDRLAAVYYQAERAVIAAHDGAVVAYERSIWIAAMACLASLFAAILGVNFIGRILSGSVDRLVEGAIRFADGEHDHRIDVQVPPELARVADEFNRMIGRIHDSEVILAELAHRDSLTGLDNRRAFDGAFAELRARMQRQGESATLVAIDIDHFKRVNDRYGHAAGDEVLRAVARVLRNDLRPFDKAFRLGGEEFVLVLPNTTVAQGRQIAERLREAVMATTVNYDGNTIAVTISLGVAPASEHDQQAAAMEAADMALYEAKRSGRNRTVVSGEKLGARDAA